MSLLLVKKKNGGGEENKSMSCQLKQWLLDWNIGYHNQNKHLKLSQVLMVSLEMRSNTAYNVFNRPGLTLPK